MGIKKIPVVLRDRFPGQQEIIYVFGAVVFIVYAWAVRGFLHQFSSLRLYHSLGEILAVFSYLMAFALFESLILISVLVFIAVLLPRKWFRDGFACKGFLAVLVTGVAMIILQAYLYSLNYAMPPMGVVFAGLGIVVLILVGLILLFQNVLPLERLLLAIEERLQVFLYLYVPLGLLGLVVVFFRTL